MAIQDNGNCVCHINGYQIKDATARNTIETNKTTQDVVNEELNFKTESMLHASENDLDLLTIEYFKDLSNIDTTLEDGSTIDTNLDSTTHKIVIPEGTTKTIVSKKFDLDRRLREFILVLDKEGTGSITPYVSINNGTNYTEVTPHTITHLIGLTTELRVKLVMVGDVTLKNLSWGGKY